MNDADIVEKVDDVLVIPTVIVSVDGRTFDVAFQSLYVPTGPAQPQSKMKGRGGNFYGGLVNDNGVADVQGLSKATRGLLVMSSFVGHTFEVAEDVGDGRVSVAAYLAVNGQGLFEKATGLFHVALAETHGPETVRG